jgi:hypothetical protein
MALAVLDRLMPGRGGRTCRFLAGPAAAQAYVVHVGVGWAVARVGGLRGFWASLDPLLRWLMLDGYGFHEGYFHGRRFLATGAAPRFTGPSRRVFDQGLGRSLWFVCGAEPGAIRRAIGGLGRARWADLWSGVGLACGYAGGAEPGAVAELVSAAGGYRPPLAQGVAFAAKARQRAGNPAPHTEEACRLVCGLTADEAARITDLALAGAPQEQAGNHFPIPHRCATGSASARSGQARHWQSQWHTGQPNTSQGSDSRPVPQDGARPRYEVWRTRIQDHFAGVQARAAVRG